ncbi:MAG: redoxin domain-containing protein [Chloroflexota bacterium]|nr:redoxin domain-containing protein [Chloroflexota bacterium]
MAVNVQNSVEATSEYNYHTFVPSETRGKTNEFKLVAKVGELAPDFELPTIEGERVRLSSFRGQKHVVLEFGSIT